MKRVCSVYTLYIYTIYPPTAHNQLSERFSGNQLYKYLEKKKKYFATKLSMLSLAKSYFILSSCWMRGILSDSQQFSQNSYNLTLTRNNLLNYGIF